MRKSFFLATLVAAALAPAIANADYYNAIKYPDPKAPLTSWTPSQQWMLSGNSDPRSDYGYGTKAGTLFLADELGDKFSEMGRASLIVSCFRYKDEASKALMEWALCGSDVRALDWTKFKKELAESKISAEDQKTILDHATEQVALAKKVVDQLDAEAKSDAGLKMIATLVENSKADWKAYIGAHKADYDRYLALKDGVRSGKTNNPAFQGCFEAIKPQWDKYVPVANKKIPWDVGRDVAVAYMSYLGDNIEGYILATSFAACAWSNSEEGEAPYAAIATTDYSGSIHGGWRTQSIGKLLAGDLKPKFSDRSYRLETFDWKYGVSSKVVESRMAIMTPSDGVIAKFVDNKDGSSKVVFKGDKVESCLQWADSNKVSNISSGGNVNYEKKCLKRGMVDNLTTAVDVPTRYLTGAKPGHNIMIVRGFPIVAWTGKKITMLYGAAIK